MKTNIRNIEKLLKRQDAAAAELVSLASIELEARNAAEKLLGDLKGSVSVELLSLPLPQGLDADNPTAKGMCELQHLRQKLELVPGLRARLQREIAESGSELGEAARELAAAGRSAAREQAEGLRERLRREFAVSHHDAAKLKAAVDTAVAGSDVAHWVEVFACAVNRGDPAESARTLLLLVERFAAGKPYEPGCTRSGIAAAA